MTDDSATRLILLDEESVRTAMTVWSLFKRNIPMLEKMMEISEGMFIKVVRGVSCPCGAACDKPCVTRTGKRASHFHQARHVVVIAAIFAMAKEIVIPEEEHIEDVLTGA